MSAVNPMDAGPEQQFLERPMHIVKERAHEDTTVDLLNKVIDERFNDSYAVYAELGEAMGVKPRSEDEVVAGLTRWFMKGRGEQAVKRLRSYRNEHFPAYPEQPPLEHNLIFTANISGIEPEAITDALLTYSPDSIVDRKFLGRYSGSQLTGYQIRNAGSVNYAIQENTWAYNAMWGSVPQQQQEHARLKATYPHLGVLSVLGIATELCLLQDRQEGGEPLPQTMTHSRDISLPAQKVLHFVDCVPGGHLDDLGRINLGPSAIGAGKPGRLAIQ